MISPVTEHRGGKVALADPPHPGCGRFIAHPSVKETSRGKGIERGDDVPASIISRARSVISRRVTDTTRAPSADSSLRRSIGTFALAAGIVNVTIGGGIFRLPADVAGTLGATAPVAYVLCAIAMGLIVLCLAEAGSRVAMTGGP